MLTNPSKSRTPRRHPPHTGYPIPTNSAPKNSWKSRDDDAFRTARTVRQSYCRTVRIRTGKRTLKVRYDTGNEIAYRCRHTVYVYMRQVCSGGVRGGSAVDSTCAFYLRKNQINKIKINKNIQSQPRCACDSWDSETRFTILQLLPILQILRVAAQNVR